MPSGGVGLQPARPDGEPGGSERLSLGVAARLSRYLQVLTQAKKMGRETISSQELADYTHVNSTQIRRDLSGVRQVRQARRRLQRRLARCRRSARSCAPPGKHNIALFGAGNLGQAIAGSDIFADHGFRVVALFDKDPGKVGGKVGDNLTVYPYGDLERVIREEDVVVGVLAVPDRRGPGGRRRPRRGRREDHLQLLRGIAAGPAGSHRAHLEPAVDLLYALYFYLT